jgi:hypothetical protein
MKKHSSISPSKARTMGSDSESLTLNICRCSLIYFGV